MQNKLREEEEENARDEHNDIDPKEPIVVPQGHEAGGE
jgi:hypothetical protein